MKVLAVAEFDPAQVLTNHRALLRAAGVDYRCALHRVNCDWRERPFVPFSVDSDWVCEEGADFDGLRTFAAAADIIQFHPAIGQPWSCRSTYAHLADADELPFGPVDWRTIDAPRRVVYFHGSKNAAANAALYARHYRAKGMEVWASTLDYVEWMGAEILPPVLPYLDELVPAPPRDDDDPLVVAHAPTDPLNCHTDEFLRACRQVGVVTAYLHGRPRREVLEVKQRVHAGFDHMRGSFSVNTLECAALGLAPICAMREGVLRELERLGLGAWPGVVANDERQLLRALRELDEDPRLTRVLQQEARRWYLGRWAPWAEARVRRMYA